MRVIRAALLCLIVAGLSMPLTSAAGRQLDLGARNIPPKIRVAAEGAVPGIALDDVKLQRAKDGVVYEVKGAADGQRYRIKVDKDGNVLDVEKDESIPLSKVPEAVRKAADNALPGARLVEATRADKGADADYVLLMHKGAKDFDVRVSPKGVVAKVEEKAPSAD